MNLKKLKFSLVLGTLLGTSPAIADGEVLGVGSTGGGFAIVCRDSHGGVSSATLLDIYEATFVHGQTLIKSSGDLVKDYTTALQAYLTLAKKDEALRQEAVADFLKTFIDRIIFISPPDELPPIQDLGGEVNIPHACGLEQVALYMDDTSQLYVSQEIWDHMDTLNKAALLHHEILYEQMRKDGERNSKRVRKIVGQIFSKKTPATTD